MIKILHKTVKNRDLQPLQEESSFKIGSWIMVEDPTQKEMEELARIYELDQDILKDATDENEAPRLEQYEGNIYVFTRVPIKIDNRYSTTPILLIMTKNCLVTISRRKVSCFDKFLEDKIDFRTTQRIKFFTQIFSQINSQYLNVITAINKHVRIHDFNVEEVSKKDIVELAVHEAVLNDFLSALVPTNAILNNLLSGKVIQLFEEDEDIIEDLFLSNGQLIEISKATLKSIVNIREVTMALVTNNLNKTMKVLTALTIILTIPTIISSIYGMNVAFPHDTSTNAFYIIMGATITLVLIVLAIFKKHDWI